MNLMARLRRAALVRRLAGCCGMLAIALQLGLAVAHDPSGLGAAMPWLGAAICHFGGDGTAPAGAPGDQKSGICPICLGLQATASALMPPEIGSVLATLVPVSGPPWPVRERAFVRASSDGSAQPRAPPAPV